MKMILAIVGLLTGSVTAQEKYASPAQVEAAIGRLNEEARAEEVSRRRQATEPNVFMTLGILGRPFEGLGLYWDANLQTVWKNGQLQAAVYPDGYVEILGAAFDAARDSRLSPQAEVELETKAAGYGLSSSRAKLAIAAAKTAARDMRILENALVGDISEAFD